MLWLAPVATLERRTQILLDEERHRRLSRLAELTGTSIGALIREAIDVAFPGVETDRARAAQRLLDAEPIDVGDWGDTKAELLDAHTPRVSADA